MVFVIFQITHKVIIPAVKSKNKQMPHPMLAVYQTMPEFDHFLYKDSGLKFKQKFWQNEKYGGPFNNSIKANGET